MVLYEAFELRINWRRIRTADDGLNEHVNPHGNANTTKKLWVIGISWINVPEDKPELALILIWQVFGGDMVEDIADRCEFPRKVHVLNDPASDD